ncbi:hypothetical protein [Caulobacter sp.]|uniref:8-oxoguanine DNA glycosylase OGG fold protein n=1 Tax=Caulobacter sp. TaxID=78 RepID=UPI003BA8A017
MPAVQIIRFSATPEEMRLLLEAHEAEFTKTKAVESQAREALEDGLTAQQAMDLIRAVCEWGKYAGIAGRVRARNSPETILLRIREALSLVDAGLVGEAVFRIAKLKGLGPSFASKALRFLRPDKAVVLDSVISEGLGFARDLPGYNAFLMECVRIGELMNVPDQPNPAPSNRVWRPCDVEMAIYAKLRGL